jgi:hypothetical protein
MTWIAFGVAVTLGHSTDLGDLGITLTLLAMYGLAAYFTFRRVRPRAMTPRSGNRAEAALGPGGGLNQHEVHSSRD